LYHTPGLVTAPLPQKGASLSVVAPEVVPEVVEPTAMAMASSQKSFSGRTGSVQSMVML
jgi:hypothetical protein